MAVGSKLASHIDNQSLSTTYTKGIVEQLRSFMLRVWSYIDHTAAAGTAKGT